jgi:hypothetical protein
MEQQTSSQTGYYYDQLKQIKNQTCFGQKGHHQ